MSTKTQYEQLVRAVQFMSEMKAWGTTEYQFGHSIASQSYRRTLTVAQQAAIYKLLDSKYRSYLDRVGKPLPVDYTPWDGKEVVQIWTAAKGGSSKVFVYAPGLDLDGMWEEADVEQSLYQIKDGRTGDLLRMLFSVGAQVETQVPERFSGHSIMSTPVLAPKPAPAPKPEPQPVAERPKIVVERVGKMIRVDIPFGQYYTVASVLEKLPSCSVRGGSHWISARYAFAVEILVRNFPHEAYREFLAEAIKTERLMQKIEDWDLVAPTLPGMEFLRSYQAYSTEMMANMSFILNDDMGLGKTAQVVAASKLAGAERVVIVCPPTLAINWSREIQKWLGPDNKVFVAKGRNPLPAVLMIASGIKYVICPHSVLANWEKELIEFSPTFVAYDEAHNFQNRSAGWTQSALRLSSAVHQVHGDAARIIPMTGTPIRNKVQDFQPLLEMVEPVAWGNQASFHRRFIEEARTGVSWHRWDLPDFDNPERALKPWIIRRLKNEVGDFPEKRQQHVLLDASDADMEFYLQLEGEAKQKIMQDMRDGKYERGAHLVLINKLRQAAEKIKVQCADGSDGPAIDWIKQLNQQEENVVSFGWYTDTFKQFKARLPSLTGIVGSTSLAARQEAVDAFQAKKFMNFYAQIKSGGTGITLTASRTAVLVGLPWTAADLQQVIDRLHRIGQDRDVSAYIMVAVGTIDEAIWDIILHKQSLSDRIVDGLRYDETLAKYERSMFSLLVERLVGEKFFAEYGGDYGSDSGEAENAPSDED